VITKQLPEDSSRTRGYIKASIELPTIYSVTLNSITSISMILLINAPAPNTSYFTPAQVLPAGTALDPQPNGKPIPKLFQPLKIRDVEFQNRIWLAPLAQYSSEDGKLTPWHMAHRKILGRNVAPRSALTPHPGAQWAESSRAVQGLAS
jgi:hypothetical protein